MSTEPYPVSDMLATVKSREVQRALLAEMAGDRPAATRHVLAAAHLELVLAEDYAQAGAAGLAFRSRLSAASCLWRAGDIPRARSYFAELLRMHPDQQAALAQAVDELERDCSPLAS